MLSSKPTRSDSWLDPESAPYLAARLSARLIERCRGRRGLFVTLTYDPSNYTDDRDCYRAAQEQQHLNRFIQRLSKYLGQSLRGKWIAKREFQRNGFLHYHLIVLDVHRIPHDQLTRLWGHGFTFINRLSPKRITYLCKYVSKSGDFPSWLLLEKPKSVKIISTSPGFWGNSTETPEPDPAAFRFRKLACHIMIGHKLETRREAVCVRDDNGTVRTYGAPILLLLYCLRESGFEISRDRRWYTFDCTWEDLEVAADRAARLHAKRAAERARRLYLIKCENLTHPRVPKCQLAFIRDRFLTPEGSPHVLAA